MTEAQHITGVVLAGGKSTRMGRDKGSVRFRGKPLVCHALHTLGSVVSELLLSANEPVYKRFHDRVVHDLHPDLGPAGGIVTAMHHSRTPYLLVMPCDMPFVPPGFLRRLIEKAEKDIVVPVHEGRTEPLLGLYALSIKPQLESFLNKGNRSLQGFLRWMDVQRVPVRTSQGEGDPFRNLNSPADLKEQST